MRVVLPVAAGLLLAVAPGTATPAGNPVVEGTDRRSPIVQVVEEVGPAVVNIATDQRVENPFSGSPFGGLLRDFLNMPQERSQRRFVQNSLGSGVIVKADGAVVTNEHVILGASRIRVTLRDGRTLLAEVVGTDGDSDLAVLRLEGEGQYPAVRLGRSSDLMIGETVIAIGNPYGFSSSVTTGVVSATGRSIEVGERALTDFIQTDALINPGNSGGPLLNIRGELIGVNNAVYGPAQGIGFAIPVDRVRRVVEDLISYGAVRSAWLGLLVEEFVPDEEEVREGIEPEHAVRVRRVFSDSPGAAAGLRPGDRLRAAAGHPLRSRAEWDTLVSGLTPGRSVALATSRAGTPRVVTITATSFPEDRALAWFAEPSGLELEAIPHSPDRAGGGLMVRAVRSGSRAERIGLTKGDVLIRLDREPLNGLDDLRRLTPRLLDHGSFYVVVVRGRTAYNLTFTL